MPLADGTNAEKEDPSPSVGWTSKADIKDATLYGMSASPPCVKVELILKYYDVPFTYKKLEPGKGVTKTSSYKKIPVFAASGRTINDSAVIAKCLLGALAPRFDAELEETITFGLQPAVEAEGFAQGADFKKYAVAHGYWVAGWIPDFVLARMSPTSAIRKKHPELKPSVEYGTAFKDAMQGKPFWGGDEPGAHDITYYGTVYPFIKADVQVIQAHLEGAGLVDWYKRMEAKMPKSD